jgi:hypothetical protein
LQQNGATLALAWEKGVHIITLISVANSSLFVRFESFTTGTMKNVVFWDIKPQFVLHRRHITSPLQSSAS